jgi:hypothetical protein
MTKQKLPGITYSNISLCFVCLADKKVRRIVMKKLVLAGALGLVLAVSGAFADHPDGFGIGIMGGGSYGWGGTGMGGPSLSLKIPSVPIYWGLNLDLGNNYFGLGLTGDYYLIDNTLTKIGGSVDFGWYLGLGGFFNFGHYNDDRWYYSGRYYNHTWTTLGFGVRLPIGIDLLIPISTIKLEVFLEAAPSIGLGLYFYNDNDEYYKHYNRDRIGLGGGIAGALGVRLWF